MIWVSHRPLFTLHCGFCVVNGRNLILAMNEVICGWPVPLSASCFVVVSYQSFWKNPIVDAQIDQKYPTKILWNFFTNFYELSNYGSTSNVKNIHTSTWLVIMWTLRHITTISFCLILHQTYTCVHTFSVFTHISTAHNSYIAVCLSVRLSHSDTSVYTSASTFISAPQLTPHVRHHSHCLPFRTRQLCFHAELLTTQHRQHGTVFLQTF